jgi:hypothetical protein
MPNVRLIRQGHQRTITTHSSTDKVRMVIGITKLVALPNLTLYGPSQQQSVITQHDQGFTNML